MTVVNTPYEEAMRYIENAREVLKKANKMDGEYQDIKYVRMGAGTAYSGVLLALDEYLKRKEGKGYDKPTSIEDYQNRLRKQNRKMIKWLHLVYINLHLAGYYHGTTSYEAIKTGLENAQKIINTIK